MSNSEEATTGFIYVLYNEMYDHHGENVYRVGKSQDVQKRMQAYTTSYIKPMELKYISIKCDNYSLVEKMVSQRLANYRMVSNREFFQTDINRIVEVIEATINDINSGVLIIHKPVKPVDATVSFEAITEEQLDEEPLNDNIMNALTYLTIEQTDIPKYRKLLLDLDSYFNTIQLSSVEKPVNKKY